MYYIYITRIYNGDKYIIYNRDRNIIHICNIIHMLYVYICYRIYYTVYTHIYTYIDMYYIYYTCI